MWYKKLNKWSLYFKSLSLVRTFNYHVFINVNDYSSIDDILQKASDIIFISEYIENSQRCQFDTDFFIICYEKTLIFVQQTEIKQFLNIFTKNNKTTIYFQSNEIRNKIERMSNLRINNCKQTNFNKEELKSFTREFSIQIKNMNSTEKTKIIKFISVITENISSYLLTKAYNKSNEYDRVVHYDEYFEEIKEKILKYKLYTNEVKENENVGEENYDDDDEAEEDD